MDRCQRQLPTCRGPVAVYTMPVRPLERWRLCDGCVADLSGAPMYLEFRALQYVPEWKRRLTAKDLTGAAA